MENSHDDIVSRIWNAVDELRSRSGLKFDFYARAVFELIFLAYANKQSQKSNGRLSVPSEAIWDHLLSCNLHQLGDAANKAMRAIESENVQLQGVLQADFTKVQNSALASLLRVFADVTEQASDSEFPGIFESILDKFARLAGATRSSEYSTPKSIGSLLLSLVKPLPGMSVYDPCVGTAGFLCESLEYVNTGDGRPVSLFGQEINDEILSIGKLHLAVHGELDADLRLGHTLLEPQHVNQEGLMQFDRIISNPPFGLRLEADLDDDPYRRFRFGPPPRRHADFAFIQHMIASLKPEGSMAVVVTHGVLFRSGREALIRAQILDEDLLEAVIGLPPALFYGTGISAAILVINKAKPPERVGKVMFINADRDFVKERNQNVLRREDISRISEAFHDFRDIERFSKIVDLKEIRSNRHNLSIPRYADSSPLAGLVTQYDSFAKHTLGELSVEINRVNRDTEFDDKPNAVYVPIAGKGVTDCLDDLEGKHRRFYQVVLKSEANNSYVAQFLGTSVGQHALSIMKAGSVIQQLTRPDLKECSIALPKPETQAEIVATHRKLTALKEAIQEIDQELSLNPTGLTELQRQLESMLLVVGELSDADHLRSIIRQGESKTVEFKETFSLDLRKDTKEKYIEEASLKTIAAFLNSDGGVLLVGVSDDEKIIGIDTELQKFHKNNLDKFLLHFKNALRTRIGEPFYPFLNYHIREVDEKRILMVECKRAERPCFLDEKVFYVRTNPATDKLEGTKQHEYIKHRFP